MDPHFWGGSSTSHVHFQSPSGTAQWGNQAAGRRRALHPSEVSPGGGGGLVPVMMALQQEHRGSPHAICLSPQITSGVRQGLCHSAGLSPSPC